MTTVSTFKYLVRIVETSAFSNVVDIKDMIKLMIAHLQNVLGDK